MRPSRTVARAALTAALASARCRVSWAHSSRARPRHRCSAFDLINLATTRDRQGNGQVLPDTAGRSDGALGQAEVIEEPGAARPVAPTSAPTRACRAPQASSAWKEPRYVLKGVASFYDHGTTAMRIPRGTVIVICGGGGCIERVVTDYGPSKAGGRIVDMYRPDFFEICGCGWWSGHDRGDDPGLLSRRASGTLERRPSMAGP